MRPILRSFGGDRSSIQLIIRGWHLTKNTPIALHLVKLGRAKVVFFSQILIPRYIPSSEVGTRGLVTSDWCIPKRRAYKRLIKPPADCRGAQKKNVMQSMTRTSQQVRQGVLEFNHVVWKSSGKTCINCFIDFGHASARPEGRVAPPWESRCISGSIYSRHECPSEMNNSMQGEGGQLSRYILYNSKVDECVMIAIKNLGGHNHQ